jgi:succinoglycan biosynthesis transport protein ExoP
LLIDGDMRSPSIHAILGVSGAAGLSNYLSGADDIHALIKQTPQPGLHILPAGPQPPSSVELLSGSRFERLVAQLMEHFDHVIVDAPPVMGLADAPLIASRVEGTIFVIEAHSTGKGAARVAVSRLHEAHARLLGVVISKFDTKRAHYGYGYNYGYGYGYGETDKAKV